MEIIISKNKNKIIQLLKTVNRKNKQKLINWLESTDFFVAPASSKFHLNVKGGLAYHSLSVYRTLKKLNKTFKVGLDWEALVLTGLLHDVCKIGIYKKVLPKEPIIVRKGESLEDYMIYERDDPLPIGHGEKSVILIQKHIELTDREIAMIRWHMGMYDQAYSRNSKDIQKVFPEAKLLYFADDLSTQYLEE